MRLGIDVYKRQVQTVRRIYSFVQSHPFPGQWLAEKEAAFETDTPLPDTPWGRIVLDLSLIHI